MKLRKLFIRGEDICSLLLYIFVMSEKNILEPKQQIQDIARQKSGLLLGDSVLFYILSSKILCLAVLVDIVGGGKSLFTVYSGLTIALLLLVISFGTSISYFLTGNLPKALSNSFSCIIMGVINSSAASLFLFIAPPNYPILTVAVLVMTISYVGSYAEVTSPHIPESHIKSILMTSVVDSQDSIDIDYAGVRNIENMLVGVVLLFLFYIALSVSLGVEILHIELLSYGLLGIFILASGLLVLSIVYYRPLKSLFTTLSSKELVFFCYNLLISGSRIAFYLPILFILCFYTPFETPNIAVILVSSILATFVSLKQTERADKK